MSRWADERMSRWAEGQRGTVQLCLFVKFFIADSVCIGIL